MGALGRLLLGGVAYLDFDRCVLDRDEVGPAVAWAEGALVGHAAAESWLSAQATIPDNPFPNELFTELEIRIHRTNSSFRFAPSRPPSRTGAQSGRKSDEANDESAAT